MTNFYTTSVLANERLARIQDARYPRSPKFNDAIPVSEPSTLNIIQACDTLKHMCLHAPHYLPEDMNEIYVTLLHGILNMKTSYDRRMLEDLETLGKETVQKTATTRVTKYPMGASGKTPKISRTASDANEKLIAALTAELARREKENSTVE